MILPVQRITVLIRPLARRMQQVAMVLAQHIEFCSSPDEGVSMKRSILFIVIASIVLIFAGCSEKQAQASSVPEIEFTAYGEQRCPRLKTANEDGIINTINAEIEAQFQRLYDGGIGGNIQTFTSSTDTTLSVLLKAESEVGYGTDGAVWGICYDYVNKMIIPCGAYISGMGYSYFEVHKNIEGLLLEKGSYEYIDVPCFYFDSSSKPILVVVALEHPTGADPWERIYYYSLGSDSIVSSPWVA